MKRYKLILISSLIIGVLILFFSSDLGLVEIEKTAIITALGIDKEENEYIITAQIALPESGKDASNEKAIITTKGHTVSGAIQEIGTRTGWYPKLDFCNLILIGNNALKENVIKFIDYFANTLRIQYSTLLAGCDGKAKEFLEVATPLDNLSSFSLQKIILKEVGHWQDVVSTDVKTFCVGYYSKNSSSYIPFVKMVEEGSSDNQEENTTQTFNSNSTNKKITFDISSTLLFKNGVMVGVLNKALTQTFNLLNKPITKSAYTVNDVTINNEVCNFLLTILENKYSLKIQVNNNTPHLVIDSRIFVRVDDNDSVNANINLTEKIFLPKEVQQKAETDFLKYIDNLINISKTTNCDFFNLEQLLYKYHYADYSKLQPNFLQTLTYEAHVSFFGQTRT